MDTIETYYSSDYFNWQKEIGAFGGSANTFKFKDHINPDDTVVDFGCGGGYLLQNIRCKKKTGVEINDSAREAACENGLDVVKTISEIKNNYADVVISNHALEHVENPIEILRQLYPKLKQHGSIIFVVPHQKANEKYIPDDVNQHLYTWNPLTLGNLFSNAGYKILDVRTIRHRWPPRYVLLKQMLGDSVFNTICKIYAYLKDDYQIKIIARKDS
ncbi:MAG: class I SAM-dependent methyltransferase [Methanosarcinaceae archaeon]|nr:class I SAM-dependent methyltransferase [Methanosarcinaceae archaeon]